MNHDLEACRATLKRRCDDLLAHPNVVAAGVGYKVTNGQRTGTLSIVCSVSKKVDASSLAPEDRIPRAVDDIPTDVIETGIIRALADRTTRYRPAPGGSSIGHIDITAGTLGCLVRKNGQTFILSNNHVLANSNAAVVGDPILQPGPFDGGRFPQDQIATLAEFIPISFPGAPPPDPGNGGGGGGGNGGGSCNGGSCIGGAASVVNGFSKMFGSRNRVQVVRGSGAGATVHAAGDNLVDCALARPLNAADVTNDILDIGAIQGQASGTLGMAVKKSGRTTEFTNGEIIQIDVVSSVSYGAGLVARFVDQLMAGAMSQGGDSGSAVLDANNRIVGLLFAGSSTTTIINRIENVFSALGVTL
ncbi:MAG: hypothetical protein R2834_07860 [Rhodothermales bacterium]